MKEKMLECVLHELYELDVGIYPKAIETGNPNIDYDERDDYKNGWNDAVKAMCKEANSILEDLGVELYDNEVRFRCLK
jgi:hypothetical protein